jgi:hypothetical protein
MPYAKHTEGNATVFEVTPEPIPFPGSLPIWGAVIFCWLPFTGFAGVVGYAALVGVLFLIAKGIHRLWTNLKDRRPAAFKVSRDGIVVGQRTIAVADIHRLVVRNSQNPNTEIVVSKPKIGMEIARQQRASITARCYKLTVEAGGAATLLAGGLDEVGVAGLSTDVARALGME